MKQIITNEDCPYDQFDQDEDDRIQSKKNKAMLITIKKVIEESIELKLPAFSHPEFSSSYFKVSENGTIILLNQSSDGCCISTWMKNNMFYDAHLNDAIKANPIAPEEFYAIWDKAIQHLETEVLHTNQ